MNVRKITTVDDLLALSEGSVVRDGVGWIVERCDRESGLITGHEMDMLWSDVSLPAELLWTPDTAEVLPMKWDKSKGKIVINEGCD